MTSLLFTNINHYLTAHEAFRLDNLNKWATKYGFKVFVRRLDNSIIIENDNFFYSSILPTHCTLKKEIKEVLKKVKPKKVVNLLEKFFPWDLVETDAEKIYFLRSCAAKLKDVLIDYSAPSSVLEHYEELEMREKQFISLSNNVITDSPTSQSAILEKYGFLTETCLEYINPCKYNLIGKPSDKYSVYNIGRRDFQKGLQYVKSPSKYQFISIGKNEIGTEEFLSKNIKKYNCLSFESYKEIIEPMHFGLFPSIWESNGYSVQECLSMGKIPIIQLKSGGNERLCNKENSMIIDFNRGNENWEQILDNMSNLNYFSQNAKDTITLDMYENSLDKFAELVC